MNDIPETPYLLTPGPLTTSAETKRAMLRDWGSRDSAFIELNARVRRRLVEIAGVADSHVTVPVQGSGTFAVEAMLGSFVAPGAACLVLLIYSALYLQGSGSRYRLIACALYIVGVVLITVTYHVPRNNVLDALDPNSAEGIAYWATYLKEWVRMNHVRTIAPLVAAALLTVSLRVE